MKKIALLLFVNIIALNCISQVEYLNNTSTWKEVKQYNDFINEHYEKYYHKFINDTIINNNLYYKVYKIGIDSVVPSSGSSYNNQIYQYIGAIREDSSRFFFVKNAFNTEAILYDFNFSVGDTIPIGFYNGYSCYPLIISIIDTVYFGTTPRKRFYTANDGNYFYFIEGIGTMRGLFGTLCITYETSSNLVCFSQDDTQLQVSTSIDCDIINGLDDYSKEIRQNNVNDYVNIYPNPAQTVLFIEFSSDKQDNTNIEIRNSLGQPILKLKKNNEKLIKIDVDNLPKGVYNINIKSDKFCSSKIFIVN